MPADVGRIRLSRKIDIPITKVRGYEAIPRKHGVRVLALDQSSSQTGFAISYHHNIVLHGDIQIAGESIYEKMDKFEWILTHLLIRLDVQHLVFEGGTINNSVANYASKQAMAVTEYYTKRVAQRAGIEMTEINLSKLKKHITGTGKAKKLEVQLAVAQILNLETKDIISNDNADAIGLLLTYATDPLV